MAVAIGSGLSFLVGRVRFVDGQGKFATKIFQVDGALDLTGTAAGQQIFEDLDALTNAETVRADIGGHVVTGMKSTPTNAIYSRVRDLAVLTFQQTNPINSSKTVSKVFAIPAPVEAIIDTDGSLLMTASGTGSPPARLTRLKNNLAAALIYIAADASITVGGWTFVASKSGLA